ncbi:MAG: transcription antitermination factor NusB [Lachnospiraceae bacterium]|nr:transcription antitermination factor NusB [Lachnospiraceae bacterium]
MTRRELRENTFLLLFQNDFYPQEELDGQMKLYLSQMDMDKFSETEKEEMKARASLAMEKAAELDEKINAVAEGWKSSRMGKVELTILRLALFEILFDDNVPQGVAINEAVELAKKFGGDDSPSFINGILAKLV